MTYTVDVTQRARRRIDEARNWYAKRDRPIADAWYLGFRAAILSLENNPEQHGLCRESERLPGQVRELLYGSGRRKTHRAIFRIVGDRVEVLTIRHLAQRDLEPEDIE